MCELVAGKVWPRSHLAGSRCELTFKAAASNSGSQFFCSRAKFQASQGLDVEYSHMTKYYEAIVTGQHNVAQCGARMMKRYSSPWMKRILSRGEKFRHVNTTRR